MVGTAGADIFNGLFFKFGDRINFSAGKIFQAQVKFAPSGGQSGQPGLPGFGWEDSLGGACVHVEATEMEVDIGWSP